MNEPYGDDVKEPQPSECDLIAEQIVFTYLHLAAEEKLTLALIKPIPFVLLTKPFRSGYCRC
jgi:hypothetical protein